MSRAEAVRAEVTETGENQPPGRDGKSAAAFRTTGEAAEALDLPAHVLRFWESKFPQIKPLKRAGRRYYRPQDIDLLRRIRQCLYQQGYTIRGVQMLLRDGALAAQGPAPQSAPAEEPPPTLSTPGPVADPPEPPSGPASSREVLRGALEEVRRELQEIRALLDQFVPP